MRKSHPMWVYGVLTVTVSESGPIEIRLDGVLFMTIVEENFQVAWERNARSGEQSSDRWLRVADGDFQGMRFFPDQASTKEISRCLSRPQCRRDKFLSMTMGQLFPLRFIRETADRFVWS
jgi:hypothetical protein